MKLKGKTGDSIAIISTTVATSTGCALIGSAVAGPVGTVAGIVIGGIVGFSTGIAGTSGSIFVKADKEDHTEYTFRSKNGSIPTADRQEDIDNKS